MQFFKHHKKKKNIIGTIISIFLGCIMIFLYIYNTESPLAAPCDLSHVQTGDLILTVGDSFKSKIVKTFEKSTDGNADYSHIGVFFRAGDSTHIVHMSIDDGVIKREGLNDFISNNGVIDYDIYRTAEPIPHPDGLQSIIDSVADTQKPFDHKFNMESEEAYYCTEFIYKTFIQTGMTEMKNITYSNYLYPNDIAHSKLFTKQTKH